MTEAPTSNHRRRNLLIGVGILGVLAVLLGFYWLFFMRGFVSTDDARFDADLVDVAPQVGGTLDAVFVSEGDSVAQGQVLYRLDTATLETALSQAQASAQAARAALAVAQANLERSERGPRRGEIRMAEATEQRTRAQADLAKDDWERAEQVFEQGAISAADRDRARTAWESADRTHDEAAAHLALLREGTRREDLAAAKQNAGLAQSRLDAAEAAARQAQLDLGHATVAAPFSGIVVRQWFDPGSSISVGKPVVTLMNPATMHVSANVKEKDLHHISLGDPVAIHVDAYPGLDLTGRVATIIRATNSQFSLIPAEGVSGSFIKVTQRVPLRIDLDRMPSQPVSPGLSVEIKIDTRGDGSRPTLAGDDG
jgi:multidrug resistance efflux pump